MASDEHPQVRLLIDHIHTQVPEADPTLISFIERWWSRTPDEDLVLRKTADDAAASLDSWRLFREHQPDTTSIWITNPNHATDGWESRHTIVRLVTPDMAFVTDSILMALSHDGLVTHHFSNVVLDTRRDARGNLIDLPPAGTGPTREVFIYAEIDRIPAARIETLEARMAQTLQDVRAAVGDYAPMRAQLTTVLQSLRDAPPAGQSPDAVSEAVAFLEWLSHDHFTLLGFRTFDYRHCEIRQVPDSALGILRDRRPATTRSLSEQPERLQRFLLTPDILAFSRSGTRSRVHRPAYPDYVGVRQFDADGTVIGEWGFLGLYTARVYLDRPQNIPLVRRKVDSVITRSGLDPAGFDGKVLNQLLATYPKADLFQVDVDELLQTALRVTYIHERRRTRLFVRHDPYGLFVHCLVYLPRELYNTQVRLRIVDLLRDAYGAEDAEFEPWFSESVLVRLQVTLRKRPDIERHVDEHLLGAQLLEVTKDWDTEFQRQLIDHFGEAESRHIGQDYALAFPSSYRERYGVRTAVHDLAFIEALSPTRPLGCYFHRRPEDSSASLHLKIFHLGEPLPLSNVIATLENMGLSVLAEYPYAIRRNAGPAASILDFDLDYPQPLDIHAIGERFASAFERIRLGHVDDDRNNRLLLAAYLDWREINILRTYARYLKQINFGFGQEFISDTLCRYPAIAAGLVRCFRYRFDPAISDPSLAIREAESLLAGFDQVALLNEDRLLRRLLELINATVRTNYFRHASATTPASAPGVASSGASSPQALLAIKLRTRDISGMPRPVPAFEIFISSPTMEGVHLRAGPIARGGIRWSDRTEDYRTEVLGLMKAQVVKNAVIVPTGAKGGFVVRSPAADPARFREQGIAAYRDFITGLLELTDNVVNGAAVAPTAVVRHDPDDPYLVVAADKGTARFSDTANEISARFGFWLGDAFASGGSNGYDHKAMGITARGAWISVQRHFTERGIDVQSDPIRVLGIGDMSGDVFGNGMLCSRSILLVAAFNHRHIFIDPTPDPAASHAERGRLFTLASSGWNDYDRHLISAGGGVFERTAKTITITPEMQTAFAITDARLSPDELINRLLQAPVDLIWNGGIGTYVKDVLETHADVGDRANDSIRIDAAQLRCRVFGEGGNLGMTQRGRVAFALAGGGVNTDFIDNSAGVDCSDHEVNIKIALDRLVAEGELTGRQRNTLLKQMTGEVGELVLVNNYRQAQLLALAEHQAGNHLTEYRRFIALMEAGEHLDRALEGLPSDEQIVERSSHRSGLTRPELAVLAAFAKTHIKQTLIANGPDPDSVVREAIFHAFPATLRERFPQALVEHRLGNEIVATQLANDLVHHMGITFTTHLVEFVSVTVSEVVRAWLAVARIFAIRDQFRLIEQASTIDAGMRLEALAELVRLGRRATRWLLRHERQQLDIETLAIRYRDAARPELHTCLLGEAACAARATRQDALAAAGLSPEAAAALTVSADQGLALTIVHAAASCGSNPAVLAGTWTELGQRLGIDWMIGRLGELPGTSHWQAMERDALIDDLIAEQGRLAAAVHAEDDDLAGWLAARPAFEPGWQRAVEEARHGQPGDFSLYSVTCRKLLDQGRLARST